ncbi:hypothetical protein ACJMK2_022618 [Sinanodonta woodiana]|uniref:Uncharacterized protein n=1 Tax=Sinanodonta woodiana TaxID=1069815 RepID=A0ABD3TLK4_SINWO
MTSIDATYTSTDTTLEEIGMTSMQPHEEDAAERRRLIGEVEVIEQNTETSNDAQSDSMRQSGNRQEDHGETPTYQQQKKPLYGEIEFIGCIGNNAKFARIDNRTEHMELTYMMLNLTSRPNVLISVIGGEENFNMTPQLLDMLRFGLVNAAQKTDAWIITGGTNIGVAKYVGEALKYSRINSLNKKKIVAIGIAPWGVIHNKDLLEDTMENKSEPKKYKVHAEDKPNERERFLNPNHNHFILVDDGTDHQCETETDFMAKLELKYNTLFDTEIHDFKYFPVVLLVINGGPRILKRVRNALSNNIPVVIVKGSGHVADLLADAVTHAEYIDDDDNGIAIEITQKLNFEQKTHIRNKMMFTKFCETKDIDNNIKEIEACLDKFQLINIFDLGSGDQDLHSTICSAVLKAKKDMVAQLRAALLLNSIDFARSAILTADKEWEPGSLDYIMEYAMKSNKVDFVELFLDNTVNIKRFLTTQRLGKLYFDKIRWESTIWIALEQKRGITYIERVARKMSVDEVTKWTTQLSGDNNLDEYRLQCGEEETFENPFLYLLIWSILCNLHDMAKLFWRKGSDLIATALLAHALFSAMASRIKNEDTNLYENIQANGREFMELAVRLLARCYRTDKIHSRHLLIGDYVPWEKSSCILVAIKTNNQTFISTTACQDVFNNIWMGKMTQDNSNLKLLICLFIPLLIPSWVNFKNYPDVLLKEQAGKSSSLQPNQTHKTKHGFELKKCCSIAMKQIYFFYRPPVVLFLSYVISYMACLCLYSYVLISTFDQAFSVVDALLIAWVISIIVGEISQVIATRYIYNEIKLKAYLANFWNIADMIIIVMFVIGMILKLYQHKFEAARVVLSVNIMICFLRLLQMFSLDKELGPKLVMIINMICNLTSFLVIFLIFVVAYAIASHAILYPNTEISFNLLRDIFRRPYWNIYGELSLGEIEGTENCTNNVELYRNGTQPRCPSESGKYVVPVLMGVYMLMCNILLLNLLISIFSNTYQKVQENADKHWRVQRFYQIQDYITRSISVPFISFVADIIQIGLFLKDKMNQCKPGKRTSGKNVFLKPGLENIKSMIREWERSIAQDFINSIKADRESDENSVKAIPQSIKLDKIDSKMQEQQYIVPATIKDARIYHSQTEYLAQPESNPGSVTLDQRMDNIEEKLQSIDDRLKNISRELSKQFQGKKLTKEF